MNLELISTIYELEEVIVQAWFMALFSSMSSVPISTLPLDCELTEVWSRITWVLALPTALREKAYNLDLSKSSFNQLFIHLFNK